MTHISEITLLIAVIALALWPVVLFALRFLRERQKRLEYIERMTKDEQDEVTTKDLVISVLKKIGCQPKVNEENHITFKYQGDDFYIAAEEENRFIMIWNPWWGSINADNEALPYLKEIINLANVNSLVTTVYMADEDEKTIGLHSRCHTFFSPREGELEEHMKMLLDYFFDMHNVIKDNMNQLGQAAINEEEKKERVKVKGFSAYKDNTMPIEAKKEEEKKEFTTAILLVIEIIFLDNGYTAFTQAPLAPVLFPPGYVGISSYSPMSCFINLLQAFPARGS